MATLLSIETSGPLCSLALYRADRWFEHTQNVERMHNMVVLGMLDDLLKGAGASPGELDAIAFAAGPGSFTGIRIAAALAQGIAFAADARVVPVSSSLALAAQAVVQLADPPSPEGILTITRSRRDAHYLAGFQSRGGALVQVMDDVLHQGHSVPPNLPGSGWVAVGHRPEWWGLGTPAMPLLEGCVVDAGAVGRLALDAWLRGHSLDPSGALPRYVSGDSPWRPQRG